MMPKTLLTLKRSMLAYENFTYSERELFSNSITSPNLNSKSFDICESEKTVRDLTTALKSVSNGISPGDDGLTKEFYEQFLNDLKLYFINSLKQSITDGHAPISQRRTIIKLIVKKDRDKRFVKNWRPVLLLMFTQKYFLIHLQKN